MLNKKNKKLDEFDDYIQSLDIDQLRELEKNSKFTIADEMSRSNEVGEPNVMEVDGYIQTLHLSELREIENNCQLLKGIDETTVEQKSKITGLDENVIILIETKKGKATLEQLMIYCSKLHIPYQKIVPEFFHH